MNSKAIIAIVCVLALACAGVGIVVVMNNNDNSNQQSEEEKIEPHDVEITDSLGNKVTVQAPVMQFCTVNTNAAEFFKILNVNDRIVGADTATVSSLNKIYGNVTDIGDYKTPSGEKIVETGAKIVISQSSSRSMSTETEQSLRDNYGITVLRMDFYGENMMRDVQELLKILISTDADTAFNGYKETYDNIVNTVKTKSATAAGNPSFLFLFTSMSSKAGTYYNENSELGKITESIHGHHALTDMGVSPGTGVTSKPSAEKVYDYDMEGKLDIVFIRGISGNAASKDYETFIKTGGSSYNFNDLNVVKDRNVYVIETDVLSGPRDYIGYVCIAEAFGISTGLDYEKLVDDFNNKYGFDVTYSYIMEQFPAVA